MDDLLGRAGLAADEEAGNRRRRGRALGGVEGACTTVALSLVGLDDPDAGLSRLLLGALLKRSEEEAREAGVRIIKPETSEAMRFIMRLNADQGLGLGGGDCRLLRRR